MAFVQHTTDEHHSAGRGGAAPASRDVGMLAAYMLRELTNAGLLICASASIANYLARPGNAELGLAVAGYLPPETALLAGITAADVVDERLCEAIPALQEYAAHLQITRAATLGSRAADLAAQPWLLRTLAAAWQAQAALAQRAIDGLEAAGAAALSADELERLEKVRGLLAEVARGAHPCIDPNRQIVIPGWAERRSLGRIATNRQVYLIIGDAIERAAVTDVSERGLGLLARSCLEAGTAIRLMVAPGRVVRGVVAWSDGRRAGIALAEPLPDAFLLAGACN